MARLIADQLPLFPHLGKVPGTVEAAPGQQTVPAPPRETPRVAILDLVPTGEPGHYRAIARVHSGEMTLTAETLKKLGITIGTRTMRRLIKAGFVTGTKVAPQVHTFALESWFAHCDRVRLCAAEGRDFWTAENLERYRTVW
jgi:hypothetical protein